MLFSGNPATLPAIPTGMPLEAQRALKPLRKLHKALAHPSRRLTPEGVHQLRTQCYRVKSMVHALALDGSRDGVRLLQAIEPMRKRAGKVRDADVLIGLAASLSDGNASEPWIEVVESLGSRHARFAVKLEKTLYNERRQARRHLKPFLKRIRKGFEGANSAAAETWGRNAVTRTLDLSSEVAEWPTLRADNLHPFRLKVKELRYVLQLSSDSDRRLIDALGEVKDAIGEWHDWSELDAIAAKALDDKGRSELSKQIAAVVQSKLRHALVLATRMQRELFKTPSANHDPRKGRHIRMKTPILTTAARMAA